MGYKSSAKCRMFEKSSVCDLRLVLWFFPLFLLLFFQLTYSKSSFLGVEFMGFNSGHVTTTPVRIRNSRTPSNSYWILSLHNETLSLSLIPDNHWSIPIVFFFFLFYGCTCGVWKFPGQGLNPSHSCDLCHSCSNVEFFNPLCWAGDWTCAFTVPWAGTIGFLTHCTTAETPIPMV